MTRRDPSTRRAAPQPLWSSAGSPPKSYPLASVAVANPAVWEAGQVVEGLVTLVSPDGPICGGCITKREQIELGEAILGDLRRGQPRDEARITVLEEALAELRDSEPAD